MLNKSLLKKNNFAFFLTFLLVNFSILLPRPSLGLEMPAYERLQPVTSSIAAAIDVATDQSGYLYVADSVFNRVVVFDENSQYAATLTGLSFPICVSVDAADNIYVGNKDTGNVEVYDSSFTYLRKLGSGDGEFIQPNDLAIAASGKIYVVDRKADIVKVYNPDGTSNSSFGGTGNGDGEFNRPISIAIDEGAQELIVLDHQLFLDPDVWIDGARIQIFDMNGVFKRGFIKMKLPWLLPGDLHKPQRVTVDDQSRLYVTDSRRNVVQVYNSSNGAYLGAVYNVDNPLRTPVGITLGGNNILYIASRGTGYVDAYQLGEIAPASSSSSSLDDSLGVNLSSFTHEPMPQLSIIPTPAALTFTSTDGSIPEGQILTIQNIGSGTMTWSASAVSSWIRLDKTSGTAPESVKITVDIASLAVGEHLGAIIITGDGALSSPSYIGVTLNIVQSAPGTVEPPTGGDEEPGDNKPEFPWILFRHLWSPGK